MFGGAYFIFIIFGFTIFIFIFYAAVTATITNEKLKNFVTTFYYNSSDRRGSENREAAAVFSLSLVQFCFCIFIICIAARTQPVPAPFLCWCIVLYFEQRQSFFSLSCCIFQEEFSTLCCIEGQDRTATGQLPRKVNMKAKFIVDSQSN